MADSRFLAAIEVGGTFTDAMVLDLASGQVKTAKTPSTPKDPAQAVLAALQELLPGEWNRISEFIHGSTIATNTVLERKGARVALVTTRGLRDVLELQRGDKTNIYDLLYRKAQPLIPRSCCFEVTERVAPDGTVRVPLDETELNELAGTLRAAGFEGLAVCTIHSYANPAHEERIREVVAGEAGDLPVVLSSTVAPEFREYERASTTAMSAYVAPRMGAYLAELEGELGAEGFNGNLFIMQSNGGVIPPATARERAINTFLSGPAAGVIGSSVLALAGSEETDFITFDMGGTSTDVSLVRDGTPSMVPQVDIAGLPVRIPTIDITTVGAGGGSLAWVDQGGMLHVGPQSAGADPGPAAYGWGGTEATVTDANVVLGIIRASQRIGARIVVDGDAAEAACRKVAEQLAVGVQDTAEAICRIADARMIEAIRLVTTERGLDPRSYGLVAFGGAGPLHAARVASALGIGRVIVPVHAGLVSAFGLLVAPLKRQSTLTAVRVMDGTDESETRDQFLVLQEGLQKEFSEVYGISASDIRWTWELDMRYEGQGFELTVPVDQGRLAPAEIVHAFNRLHEERYGHAQEGDVVEAVTWRVTAEVPRRSVELSAIKGGEYRALEAESPIYWGGEWVEARFVNRGSIAGGQVFDGPCVIEEATSATFVPPGWTALKHASGNLILSAREAAR